MRQQPYRHQRGDLRLVGPSWQARMDAAYQQGQQRGYLRGLVAGVTCVLLGAAGGFWLGLWWLG
jgi:hypothetical protein